MRTFKEWGKGGAIRGLAITLTNHIRDELMLLQGHIQACLGSKYETQDLCPKIVTAGMDFWESYVPMFTGFYSKLLANVYEGGFSKALKDACWGLPSGILM